MDSNRKAELTDILLELDALAERLENIAFEKADEMLYAAADDADSAVSWLDDYVSERRKKTPTAR